MRQILRAIIVSRVRRVPHEIIELVNIGMPPMEAIKAATSVAAACIGVDKRAGSIKAGLEADLIVVERNPLTDINAIQDVIIVINNGKIVVNRRACETHYFLLTRLK